MYRWSLFRWGMGVNDAADRPERWRPRFGSDMPVTVEEYLNQPYWMRDIGGVFEGAGTDMSEPGEIGFLPVTDPMAEPESVTITPSRTSLFSLEVRDSSTLAKIADIASWTAGKITEQTGKAAELSFTVAAANAIVEHLARPNVIWARDRWGMLVGIFAIQRTTRRSIGDARFFDVEGAAAEIQLIKEIVLKYTTGYEYPTAGELGIEVPFGGEYATISVPIKKPVLEIVQELLSLQVQAPKVGLGHIDPAIAEYEIAFNCERTNIFGALLKLQEILPAHLAGHFYITAKNRLDWRTRVGSTGKTIEIGAGIKNLKYEIAWDELVTRLYAYGYGQSDNTRVKLTDYGAGQANEYLDADTQGTYGIVPGQWYDNRIKHASTLLAAAQRVLENRKHPTVRVEIDLLDLAKADNPGLPVQDEISIGSEYTVTDAGHGIAATVKVISLKRDLKRALLIDVEMATRSISIDSIIADLIEQSDQAFDVLDDGQRYPNVARIMSGDETPGGVGEEALSYRGGDLRYTEDGLAYYDAATGEWVPIPTGDALAEEVETIVESMTGFGGGTAARLCKITGGSAGNWTVQEVAANGDLVGSEYTGVTVADGHEDAFAVGVLVAAAFCLASSGSTTVTPKILNAFRVNT